MKFIKDNISLIARLIVTHIGLSVFGIAVFMSTNQISRGMMLAASVFCALFYGVIVYSTLWEAGAKDKPAIDAGRMPESNGRGFYITLAGEMIAIVLVIVMLAASFFNQTSAVAGGICAVLYPILVFADSCFTGIMLYFNPQGASFILTSAIYLFASIFISGAGALGYAFGSREISILPKKKAHDKK